MGRMFDNWRYWSRLSRVVFVAIALLGALLWTLWHWPAPMTSRFSETGEVVSAAKGGVMVLELANGKRVRAITPDPVPKSGDRFPMIVETYEDGTVRAYIDRDSLHSGLR